MTTDKGCIVKDRIDNLGQGCFNLVVASDIIDLGQAREKRRREAEGFGEECVAFRELEGEDVVVGDIPGDRPIAVCFDREEGLGICMDLETAKHLAMAIYILVKKLEEGGAKKDP